MSKEEDKYQSDLINMILGGLIALKSEQQVGGVSRSPGSETLKELRNSVIILRVFLKKSITF